MSSEFGTFTCKVVHGQVRRCGQCQEESTLRPLPWAIMSGVKTRLLLCKPWVLMRRWGGLVTAEQHCPSEAALDFKMQRLNSPNVLYVSASAQSVDYHRFLIIRILIITLYHLLIHKSESADAGHIARQH